MGGFINCWSLAAIAVLAVLTVVKTYLVIKVTKAAKEPKPEMVKRANLDVKTIGGRVSINVPQFGRTPSEEFPNFMKWYFGRPQSQRYHMKYEGGSTIIERKDIEYVRFYTKMMEEERKGGL